MTLKDYNRKRTIGSMKREFGEGADKIDWEAEVGSDIRASEQRAGMRQKLVFGKEPEYNPGDEEQAAQEGYRANIEHVTGQTFQSDFGLEQEINALPRVIKRKGMEIRVDAPILSNSEAIKNAISIGLGRVAEAITKDVVANRTDFGDDKPEGFQQGLGVGKFQGSYPSASAYYSNQKVPFWRGGLRGSFAYMGAEDRFNHMLQFTAHYAVGVEEGGKSGAIDGAWVQDKLSAYWQTTHGGWVGELEIKSSNPHPFTAGVAEKIFINMENFGYLDIFGEHFVASIKG